ncbi:MAG TPA: glutamine-hydrolyzing GMP synthase, partial [Micromonosporaceae bacterium]|nr:glutamine-hydrolyzing GMP synthase [Micromonosporaceae bacterium]
MGTPQPSAGDTGSARPVLVVDFGAQYAQLIARRVREAHVYSEIVPHDTPVAQLLARDPAAIVLSGGPASVYEPGAPRVDPALFSAGVPVFGICYGFQAMAQGLGGSVAHTGQREFGGTDLRLRAGGGALLGGLPEEQTVWMSHGDCVTNAPEGFTVTASTDRAPVAAFEDRGRRLAGVQFHPEVAHTPYGQRIIERFLYDIAGVEPTWTPANIIEEQVAAIRSQVGDAQVICGLSGGVDSAVAAALVHRAVGDQLTCVFVDHGLLRAGEAEQVEKDYVAATGIRLKVVDAADRFLAALAGVTDPEQKRKIIGREFIRAFESAARELDAERHVEF